MTAYSFMPRFIAPILAGTKIQTLRRHRTGRSRHARPGETVQLYTGLRTKFCRLIGTATCVRTADLMFRTDRRRAVALLLRDGMPRPTEELWGLTSPPPGAVALLRPNDDAGWHDFAVADGFDSFLAWLAYWDAEQGSGFSRESLYFMSLIQWRDFQPAPLAADVERL